MKRIDDWIIERVQDAYLWLWDWTGATVAACQFVMFVMYIVLRYGANFRTRDIVFVGIFGVLSAIDSYRQINNQDVFNAWARRNREVLSMRMLLNVFIVDSVFVFAVDHNGWGLVSETTWVVLSYLMTTQTRDREPREFFDQREAVRNER